MSYTSNFLLSLYFCNLQPQYHSSVFCCVLGLTLLLPPSGSCSYYLVICKSHLVKSFVCISTPWSCHRCKELCLSIPSSLSSQLRVPTPVLNQLNRSTYRFVENLFCCTQGWESKLYPATKIVSSIRVYRKSSSVICGDEQLLSQMSHTIVRCLAALI